MTHPTRTPLRGRLLAALLLPGLVLLAGCGEQPDVDVVDPSAALNLSGNWNDTDSQQAAAALTTGCLSGHWLTAFQKAHGRLPIIRIGHIRVRVEDLDDEIDTGVITDALERALISSGRVQAIASRAEANAQTGARDTRTELATQAKAGTAPKAHHEMVADYILAGDLISQNDAVLDKGLVSGTYKRVKFYQITMTLTDLASNEVVWSGNTRRKKLIQQSTKGW